MRSLLGVLVASAVVSVAIDQATKGLVRSRLGQGLAAPYSMGSIRHVVNLGQGAGFSIGRTTLVLIWALELVVVFELRRVAALDSAVAEIGLGLGLGGISGNLLDRLRRRGIVDFIDLRLWPVFNFADCAIVASVALVGFELAR